MGETRVDLLNLLQDLADAYPGELEETVLTEIVANALDSGASVIAIDADTSAASLTILDDGSGMRRADLRRFHDVASSTKRRGEGIGFAGIGIKLGLLLSDEVTTETRRGKAHVSTSWALSTRRRAPWRWVTPAGRVGVQGTAVTLRLSNPLSSLLDSGYIETMLRRHFEPLFDRRFDGVLRKHYPAGVRFDVNGLTLAADHPEAPLEAPIALRLPRKRIPSAVGYLARFDEPLPEGRRGIAISTFGKVIKRGWEWLGVTPTAADRMTGVVEAPELAAALTLNKVDFLRAGPRGAIYLGYRKALQEAVTAQLAAWGDAAEEDRAKRRLRRPIERDLQTVLADLAERFPILAMLVERRAGGGRKLPVSRGNGAPTPGALDLFAPPPEPVAAVARGSDEPTGDAELPTAGEKSGAAPPEEPRPPRAETKAPVAPGARRSRHPMRLGLSIQFESRPGETELARLVETTVWVNDSHPAYRRAVASRSEGYHLAVAVAVALADVAVEPAHERAFVAEFLARWGESADGRKPGTRRAARRGVSAR